MGMRTHDAAQRVVGRGRLERRPWAAPAAGPPWYEPAAAASVCKLNSGTMATGGGGFARSGGGGGGALGGVFSAFDRSLDVLDLFHEPPEASAVTSAAIAATWMAMTIDNAARPACCC